MCTCQFDVLHAYYDSLTSFHQFSELILLFELGHSISYKIGYACASQPDQSLRCLAEDALDPLLPTECLANTDQTAQTDESLPWAHMQPYVVPWLIFVFLTCQWQSIDAEWTVRQCKMNKSSASF